MIRNHMIENADLHRELAMQRRNRGLHTGKSAAGWDWSRPDPAKGSFERARQAAVTAWQAIAGLAAEDYLRAVFPERYGDETLEMAIVDRRAADTAALLETF